MGLQRVGANGTAAEVLILAIMAFVLGLACLVWAAFPIAQDTPRGLLAAWASSP
jgi:hypothetical protein